MKQFQPIQESLIKELNLHYDTVFEATNSKVKAQKQTAAYFGVSETTVWKYVIKPRSKKSPQSYEKKSRPTPADFKKLLISAVDHKPIMDSLKTEIKKSKAQKTFIITGWEVRVAPNYKFVDCLRQIAKNFDAELLLTTCYLPDLKFLPTELRNSFKVLTEDFHFNDNLFFKFTETHALASSPLLGWKGAFEKRQLSPD